MTWNLRIGNWVLYKRDLSGDNSFLKSIIKFRKKIIQLLVQSSDTAIFLKNKKTNKETPKHTINFPQKLLIIG